MRPRAGDFLYTRDEFELLCRQIETLRRRSLEAWRERMLGRLKGE